MIGAREYESREYEMIGAKRVASRSSRKRKLYKYGNLVTLDLMAQSLTDS